MADYQRVFALPGVVRIHELFHVAITLAEAENRVLRARGLPGANVATVRELQRAYVAFNSGLEDIARVTAVDATKRIQERLKATAKRPDTHVQPHLRNLIRSRPLHRFGGVATGEVGVADEAWLDKAVNPVTPQYGPYWRAQEKGSTKQVGRIIRGFFFGPGYSGPEVPQAGRGDQPIFVSARSARALSGGASGGGSQGGSGGFGTIREPIQPRHFIRDGANLAERDWRLQIRLLEGQTMTRLAGVVGVAGVSGRRGRRP